MRNKPSRATTRARSGRTVCAPSRRGGRIDFNVGIQGPPLGGVADAAASADPRRGLTAVPVVRWDSFARGEDPLDRFDGIL